MTKSVYIKLLTVQSCCGSFERDQQVRGAVLVGRNKPLLAGTSEEM